MSADIWSLGRWEGREAFRESIRQALAEASHAGVTEMLWCDPDFSDWPLAEKLVVEPLAQWAQAGRKLRLLAGHWGVVQARDARFVQWRQTWAHLIEAHVYGRNRSGELPSMLWTSHGALERLDVVHCTGHWVSHPSQRLIMRERFEEFWRRSSPGFAASTLGL